MSVSRQFPSGSKTTLESIRELCMMPRKDRVAKYQSDMRPLFEEQLMQARSVVVAKYRASPGVYPDGIDTPLHRWYVASDWANDGTFIGPLAPAMNGPEAKARADEKARKLAVGRAALAEVEAKLGVTPYKLPPDDQSQPTESRETETDPAPWIKAGVSRATWYRRQSGS